MKRTLPILTALLAILSSSPVLAYDCVVGGIYYNLDTENNTASVTYYSKNAKYNIDAYIDDIDIPEAISYKGISYLVVAIEAYSFSGCSDMTSVNIPKTIISIGSKAFYNCYGLTSVYFDAEDCKTMGSKNAPAFEGCESFTSLTIGGDVKTIPSYAFYGCYRLKAVTIPRQISCVGDNAFAKCSGLVSVAYNAEDCKHMGYNYAVFYGCDKFSSLTIGENVKNIPSYAFYGCNNLTSVTIPDSVEYIGPRAFYSCGSLKTVIISNSVKTIQNGTFMWCRSITSVSIGKSVESICDYAFSECHSLTSVDIPNSVRRIYDYAFSSCLKLTSVDFPNTVSYIGNYSFSGCTCLTSLTIPSSVSYIGESAFYNCSGLKSVAFNAENCETIGSSSKPVFEGCTSFSSRFGDSYWYSCFLWMQKISLC